MDNMPQLGKSPCTMVQEFRPTGFKDTGADCAVFECEGMDIIYEMKGDDIWVNFCLIPSKNGQIINRPR